MQKIVDIFFSPEGRIPRGLWWATLLIYAIPMGFLLTLIQKSNPQLATLFQFLIGIPFIFVNGKRFHDRNKSAWWVLIGFVPFIGGLWVFIECGFLAGTPRENRFGLPNIFGNESKMMRTSGSNLRGQRPF
ncbi:MAG: DUF805 domain-containing protein [Kiritimatiellales bacterium]|nr:DUF805 domain-containing protein [Kiritimatiellales bacterium]